MARTSYKRIVIPPRPEWVVEQHHSNKFILEAKPITVAVLPSKGRSLPPRNSLLRGEVLKDCLVLHPRYVPSGFPHEIVSIKGYGNGRTIDILLEEPIILDGKEHWALNFKGSGANADREMVIHPTRWCNISRSMLQFSGCGFWVPRKQADKAGRFWGAVTSKAAHSEIYEDALLPNGIPSVANLQANAFPAEVMLQISKVERRAAMRAQLSQVVRACETNLRMTNSVVFSDGELESELDAVRLAEIDADVLWAQLKLAAGGRMLKSEGDIITNRFINGTFTDSENFCVRNYEFAQSARFAVYVMLTTFSILTENMAGLYLEMLNKITGYPFQDAQKIGEPPLERPTILVPSFLDLNVTEKSLNLEHYRLGISRIVRDAFAKVTPSKKH